MKMLAYEWRLRCIFLLAGFVLGIVGCSVARAAPPPEPPCYPVLGTGVGLAFRFNLDGAVMGWFCDVGHKWYRACNGIMVANVPADKDARVDELKNATSTAVYSAAWKSNVVRDIYDPTAPEHTLLPLCESIDWPRTAPPSGYITITTTAYVEVTTKDHKTMLPVGTVPLGLACSFNDVAIANNKIYFGVPRDRVTFSGSVKPQLVFSLCGG